MSAMTRTSGVNKPRAVVLLSGGLDSATVLSMAVEQGFDAYALSVHYGQRHSAELAAAERVARGLGAREHRIMGVDLAGIGGSALTDPAIAVPTAAVEGIPITYVPARNTLMLSLALGWAEVLGAEAIFIGVNAVDYSGYPTADRSSFRPSPRWRAWGRASGSRARQFVSKRRSFGSPKPKSSARA